MKSKARFFLIAAVCMFAFLYGSCNAKNTAESTLPHNPCPPDSFTITDLVPNERYLISTDTRAYVEAVPDDPKSVRLIKKDAGSNLELIVHVSGNQVNSLRFAEDSEWTSKPLRPIKTQNGKIVVGGDQDLIMQDWFAGAEHTFLGVVQVGPYRFQSDKDFPLTFQVVKDVGYVYLCGRGTVQREGGAPVTLGARQAASDWLEPLTKGTLLQKQGAAIALGYYRDKSAVPALIAATKDTASWKVRRDAVEALGRIGDAAAESALAAAVSDENPLVNQVALESLAKIGCPGMPQLKKYLAADDKKNREAAVYALGASTCEEAITTLANLAGSDKDSSIRKSAVNSLGKIGKPSCLPTLIETLKSDTDRSVRAAAVDGVAKIGGQQSVDAILGAVKDKDENVRQRTVAALAESSDPRALPALEEIAAKDSAQKVRKAAKEAAARKGKTASAASSPGEKR
jgi:HEAT repeat protein